MFDYFNALEEIRVDKIKRLASSFITRIRKNDELYIVIALKEKGKFSCIQFFSPKAEKFITDETLFTQFVVGVYDKRIEREHILEDLQAAYALQ